MARSVAPLAALLMLACLLAPHTAWELSCGQVVSILSPCIAYARSGGVMPAGCCSAVKSLNAKAGTTTSRQTACTCLKSIIASIGGLQPALVAGIPSKCGVNIPYPIKASTDCSKVV